MADFFVKESLKVPFLLQEEALGVVEAKKGLHLNNVSVGSIPSL